MTPRPTDPRAPREEPPDEIFTPTNGWPIRKLYVFLSVDEGGEGICATQFGQTVFPMITSNTKMLERLKQDAKRLSRISGKRIVLAEFKRNGKELWATDGKDAG